MNHSKLINQSSKFELCFSDVHNLDTASSKDLDFVKAKTKEVALSCYKTYNDNVPQNLSKYEFIALKTL